MRTLLAFVTILGLAGCAETQKARRPAGPTSSHKTPVVSERPSISDRHRAKEARDAEQAGTASTEVLGSFRR